MSERNPTGEGSAEYATSFGVSGVDEYDMLLASLGRTEEEDQRVSVHEAGHAVAARLLGHPLGGATIDPGPGYEGRVWGAAHAEAFAEGRETDASDVRDAIAPMMPEPGEDISSVSDVFANIYGHCIELAAGRAAERMLLDDHHSQSAGDDLRQMQDLALLICKSDKAIETFITHCGVAARDLLMPYGDAVMVLSTVLRIRRTLDSAEIDKVISDVEAWKALAIEHRRRAEWRKREVMAIGFERDHLEFLGFPPLAQD
ncbi:hypothetical protein AS156_30285 [Bradyrhizobium macuxiense]|uniref:Peptidase M41 domain-containing protein n=1 Tax=Bradyrhizobium macuxiense TaxID=1755647 RepID=A0A109K336_9BRAD|nr:hypothetical protein [Bradyrhizobium macuxiense]KWV59815.1 hypothetical protein AS156_30285 [Bradyrhizobium macuxiense]